MYVKEFLLTLIYSYKKGNKYSSIGGFLGKFLRLPYRNMYFEKGGLPWWHSG